MSEIFVKKTQSEVPGLPRTNSLVINSESQDWLDCSESGFLIKPLLEDSEASLRTWLMKVEAGAFSPMHAHEEIEQIYVLEGSFYDQDNNYRAGDFIVRAPGAMHTAGSETGAVVLLFYSSAG